MTNVDTGQVIDRAIDKSMYRHHGEVRYGNKKEKKDTTDWIIYNDQAVLFVECKTKRMNYSAKSSLLNTQYIDGELEILAACVVQTYKTIRDYTNGLYPSLSYDENRNVFPLIVLLEDWYLFGNHLTTLDLLVHQNIKSNNIPLDYLKSMPYSLCSIDEFEEIAQLINHVDITSFIHAKVLDPEMCRWAYHAYMRAKYPEHISKTKFLFKDDYQDIFTGYT